MEEFFQTHHGILICTPILNVSRQMLSQFVGKTEASMKDEIVIDGSVDELKKYGPRGN